MSTLHLCLLDKFQWTLDGQPLPPLPDPSQDLLARLVLCPGQPRRRADLATDFWPEAPADRARSNLRKPLYDLRRLLPDPNRYLLDADHALTWRRDAPYTLDVDEFLAAAKAAQSAAELERAVGLYTGDLLPSCYDEWIEFDRERLGRTFSRLLRRAIAEREAAGEIEAALAFALRWHTHEPEDEEAETQLERLRGLALQRAAVPAVATPPPSPTVEAAQGTNGEVHNPAIDPEAADASNSALTPLPQAGAPHPPEDGTNRQPEATSPARSHRLRTVLIALLAALVLAALGYAFVRWWQAPAATLPADGYNVTIQPASPAASAGTFLPIRGTASGLPRRVRLWTVVRFGASYWPQQAAFRTGDMWTGMARIGGSPADSGRDLDVLAVLATKDADDQLGAWLRFGYQTGAYPPLAALPAGTRVVASTTVHVE